MNKSNMHSSVGDREIFQQKRLNFSKHPHLEQQGERIEESLNALITFIESNLTILNHTNPHTLFYRLPSQKRKQLMHLVEVCLEHCLHLIAVRTEKMKNDYEHKIRFMNQLLGDLERCLKKYAIDRDVMYELALSLKLHYHFDEAQYFDSQMDMLVIKDHKNNFSNSVHLDKLIKRLIARAHYFSCIGKKDIPSLTGLGRILLGLLRNECIQNIILVGRKEGYVQFADAQFGHISEQQAKDQFQKMTEESCKTHTTFRKLNRAVDKVMDQEVVDEYNKRSIEDAARNRFVVVADNYSYSANKTGISYPTFTICVTKQHLLKYMTKDGIEQQDDSIRHLQPFFPISRMGLENQLMPLAEFILSPEGDVRLACAPLFSLRNMFIEPDFQVAWNKIEMKIQQAWIDLCSIQDKLPPKGESESEDVQISVRNSIEKLLASEAQLMRGQISREEYLYGLQQLGLVIDKDQGKGSHWKADNPLLPLKRPIIVTKDKEFPRSLIKNTLEEAGIGIPFAAFYGIATKIFWHKGHLC